MMHVFKGMFRKNCQEESVPLSLVVLVNMLLDGSSLTDQSESYQHRTTASLTLSQLLTYNTVPQYQFILPLKSMLKQGKQV